MTEKSQNKYRIKSHRLPHWDYAGDGYYFITIVTQNRECNLGKIIDGNMISSDFGEIINTQWFESFEIRDELIMDTYIMMPNHLHAIVILDKTHGVVETHGRASLRRRRQQPPQSTPQSKTQPFSRKPKSISSFIGGFKSAVNSKIDDYIDENNLGIAKYNRNNHFFQPNYHDHIIRNENEYIRIAQYIINNPKDWKNDTFNNKFNNTVKEPLKIWHKAG